LPTLMQVNFLPPAVAVLPTFLQEEPAVTAAVALRGVASNAKARRVTSLIRTW